MVCHYLVKGRVQGVGFRWFVQREAAEIGLRGGFGTPRMGMWRLLRLEARRTWRS